MLRRLLTILPLIAVSLGILLGQAFYGSIVGTVDDSSGAALASTTVNERFNLEFRSEVFNLFNRVQFGQPNRTVTTSSTSTFGEITPQINDPHLIQLALRLRY